jgi:transcriptional regulator with XRE-family HTH domain
MSEFWKNVNKTLKQQHSNQIELSSKSGIILQTLRGWVSKEILPRVDDAHKIAQALNVTVEYLLTGNQADLSMFELLSDERKEAVLKFLQYQLYEQQQDSTKESFQGRS